MVTRAPNRAATAPVAPTMQQMFAMDQASQRNIWNAMSTQQRAAHQTQYKAYQLQRNRQYMQQTDRLLSICPPQSGNALSQTYTTGAQLIYNVQTAQNAFLEGFIVRVNINIDLAAGTSPVYNLSDSGELAFIQEIDLLYGNTQLRFRPYMIPHIMKMMKFLGFIDAFLTVPTGFSSLTNLQNYLYVSPTLTKGTTPNFIHEYYVPLNWFAKEDARGMLPIMSGETTAQISINTCPTLLSSDPSVSPLFDSGDGTGVATVHAADSNTIQVIAVYRNGQNGQSSTKLALNLAGLSTIQVDIDPPLNNLQSGSIFRQKINKAENLIYALLTVFDGVAKGRFSAYTNLNVLELDKDSSGNNLFWKYGTGTNIDTREYFAEFRRQYGQDLKVEGVIPLVMAPSRAINDPDNLNGSATLNTKTSGWTDVNYGLQLGATGAFANPHVECHLIYLNDTGLLAG